MLKRLELFTAYARNLTSDSSALLSFKSSLFKASSAATNLLHSGFDNSNPR